MSENTEKVDIRNKFAARLDRLRATSGAISIQSIWRGHKHRKSLMQIAAEYKSSKVTIGDKADHAPSMFAKAEETELESFSDIFMDEVKHIQCCVDGAEGLPVNCTATRVTVKLLTPNRTQIGESMTCFSHPDSPAHSPSYECISSWSRSLLGPHDQTVAATATILCRIDTLERPSLRPVCVGYGALKLCTNEHDDEQPMNTDTDVGDNCNSGNRIKLNSGSFLIPLCYGKIPQLKAISEDLIESMAAITGA